MQLRVLKEAPPSREDFSLVKGGPFFNLETRLGSTKNRIITVSILTWLVPFLLALAQKVALGTNVQVSFLEDIAVTVRFLISIPILIAAEGIIGRNVVNAFCSLKNSDILSKNNFKFDFACQQFLRWRNSPFAEAILLGLIALITFLRLKSNHLPQVSSWHTYYSSLGPVRTWSGWWYFIVSVPIYQFILFRWFWRYAIWVRFLWNLSRIDLNLIPAHPDLCGGLGFFSIVQESFSIIFLSFSTVMSAIISEKVLVTGSSLPLFGPLIGTYAFLGVVIVLLPLFFFTPLLIKTRSSGIFQYGDLADQYTHLFNEKWIKRHSKSSALLGSSDIQSLSDLGSTFQRIEDMKAVAFKSRTVLILLVSSLLPFLPLVLMKVPVSEILKGIARMILKP